jgi:predicted RNase H-like HicB family nuclease
VSDYHINIFYSEEDQAYIADIPDLEACSALGSTPDEALAEVKKAKEAWLAAARETGKPIPPPRYRPAIYQTGR